MVSVVEGGADEIVHGGVGDDEGLAAVFLDVEDAGEECTGLSDDEAARFEEQVGGFVGESLGEGGCVFLDLLCGVVCRAGGVGSVVDAEPAAGVDVADVVAITAQIGDEGGDTSERGGEGVDFADLRADVDGDAGGVEPLGFFCCAVDGAGGFDVDAELVFAEAGGDVGVGFGEDVGVDAEGEAGALVECFGARGEEMEFGFGLDVEEEDVGAEGGVDLPDLFADTGEDDFFQGGLVGLADALEFATGDDVEACSLLCQQAEDGEGGVGFDGVADGVEAVGEGLFEKLEALSDLRGGVDVEGSAVGFGEGGEIGAVAMELAVAIDEGAGAGGRDSDFLLQNSEALCWKGVGRFRNDNPGDEVRDEADATREERNEGGENADEVEVPTVVEREAGADSGNHSVVAWTGELTRRWI